MAFIDKLIKEILELKWKLNDYDNEEEELHENLREQA